MSSGSPGADARRSAHHRYKSQTCHRCDLTRRAGSLHITHRQIGSSSAPLADAALPGPSTHYCPLHLPRPLHPRANMILLKHPTWPTKLALLILLPSCGGDTIDATPPPWDVPQPLPLKQGVYRVTFEIEQDGCTPSLEKIQSLNSEWPADYTLLSYYFQGETNITLDRFDIGSAHPRTGRYINFKYTDSLYLTGYNESGILNTLSINLDNSSEYQQNYLASLMRQCIKNKPNNSFKEEIKTTYISEEEITVRINSSWTLPGPCYDSDRGQGYELELMPTTSCTERYTLRYNLERECPMECIDGGISMSYFVGLSEPKGQDHRLMRLEDMTCICDGINIWQ